MARAVIGRITPAINGTLGSRPITAKLVKSLLLGPIFCLLVESAGTGDSSNRASRRPALKLGVNLNTIYYWDGSRPFMNLIYGSDWQMQGPNGWEDVPTTDLDHNGWIKSLPEGYRALRTLSMPAITADIVCRWQGADHGSMAVIGNGVASNPTRSGNEMRFRYRSTYPEAPKAWAVITYNVDAQSYVRDIDCRESTARPTDALDPTLIATADGFRVIRFMKWQPAVETNRKVAWANRNKPGDGSYLVNDGVPVEQMVSLANRVGADPWFSMPWNADDDYITRFAAYVRDNLAPGRQAYVETSNEVWNGGYAVMRQAQREGAAEGLNAEDGPYGQAMYRYAEKTQHIMQLWSKVFVGQMNRIVRVVSAQNVSPFWSDKILGYGQTAVNVDALATAPYWAMADSDYAGQSAEQIMKGLLPSRIDEALGWAAQQKAIACKYGTRYIAYEGGQHVWLNNNAHLVAQVERDPRMAELYSYYLDQWKEKVGDTLALFALIGPIDKAGFGMVEYAGQPLTDAPKMRAVKSFLRQQGVASSEQTPGLTARKPDCDGKS